LLDQSFDDLAAFATRISAEKAIERALVDRNRGAGNRDICILNT